MSITLDELTAQLCQLEITLELRLNDLPAAQIIRAATRRLELQRREIACLGEFLTREQFNAAMLAMEPVLPLLTKLREIGVSYDKLQPHLKADLHARMGLEPVQMFKRVPVTKTQTPEKAAKFREWAGLPDPTAEQR